MTQQARVDKVKLGRFYDAFSEIIRIRLQKMDDEGNFQNGKPFLDGGRGNTYISGYAVHGEKLTTVNGTNLYEFFKG